MNCPSLGHGFEHHIMSPSYDEPACPECGAPIDESDGMVQCVDEECGWEHPARDFD